MRLRWSGRALDDLDRIALFNERRSEAWAVKVQRRIIERAEALTSLPFQGRPLGDGERRLASVSDVQYVLGYQVVGNEEVVILSVHSTRERRDAW